MNRSSKILVAASWRVLLFASAAMIFWTLPSYAWNATGHKATAEIAFGLLVPEQQQYVDRILRAHPRFRQDFAAHMPENLLDGPATAQALWLVRQASIWPDILRDIDEEDRARFHRGSWHYINMPVYLEESDEKKLDGKLEHNMSTEFSPPLRQNLNVIQALQGNLQVWGDSNSSDSEKAVALCWVLHLVGDIHQPLHTVALFSQAYYPEGDRGGNSVRISWEPKPINLHSVWDGMPDRFADLEPGDLTKDLLRTDVVSVTAIEFWMKRHLQLAKVFVYTDAVKEQLLEGFSAREFPEVELSEFYLSNGAVMAKEQVILAGHRIAGFLQMHPGYAAHPRRD